MAVLTALRLARTCRPLENVYDRRPDMYAGANGLGKSVISDAIMFVMRGLKGASLAEAANVQLLQRNGSASISVSLCFGFQGATTVQPALLITRTTVSKTRTVITARHGLGEETRLSEVRNVVTCRGNSKHM